MILEVNKQDISQLVERIEWSGDTKQVARKLAFTIVSKSSDKYIPKHKINIGDLVLFKTDKNKIIFGGILFDIRRSSVSNVTSYLAYDFLYYISKSELSRVFDASPEAITEAVCRELKIPFGTAVKTGIKVYLPALKMNAYEIIMTAYTEAAAHTGKKYILLIKNMNKVCVIEKGKFSNVILDGDYNLIGTDYELSIQNMVNKVLITNKTGKVIDQIEDTKLLKYGIIQKVCNQSEGKNAKAEAKTILHGFDRIASTTALSDVRAVAGYSIILCDPASTLSGKFYIESDSHTFENGKATMKLQLAFSNLMDEKRKEK